MDLPGKLPVKELVLPPLWNVNKWLMVGSSAKVRRALQILEKLEEQAKWGRGTTTDGWPFLRRILVGNVPAQSRED
jgi:hypothetical protein